MLLVSSTPDGKTTSCAAANRAAKSRSSRRYSMVDDDFRVEVIGHAALRVQHGGRTLLTDPWLVGPIGCDSAYLFPPLVHARRLASQTDAIYVSHIHKDHFNGRPWRSSRATSPSTSASTAASASATAPRPRLPGGGGALPAVAAGRRHGPRDHDPRARLRRERRVRLLDHHPHPRVHRVREQRLLHARREYRWVREHGAVDYAFLGYSPASFFPIVLRDGPRGEGRACWPRPPSAATRLRRGGAAPRAAPDDPVRQRRPLPARTRAVEERLVQLRLRGGAAPGGRRPPGRRAWAPAIASVPTARSTRLARCSSATRSSPPSPRIAHQRAGLGRASSRTAVAAGAPRSGRSLSRLHPRPAGATPRTLAGRAAPRHRLRAAGARRATLLLRLLAARRSSLPVGRSAALRHALHLPGPRLQQRWTARSTGTSSTSPADVSVHQVTYAKDFYTHAARRDARSRLTPRIPPSPPPFADGFARQFAGRLMRGFLGLLVVRLLVLRTCESSGPTTNNLATNNLASAWRGETRIGGQSLFADRGSDRAPHLDFRSTGTRDSTVDSPTTRPACHPTQ